MKTEMLGVRTRRPLEERLRVHFEAELARAREDVPRLPWPLVAPSPREYRRKLVRDGVGAAVALVVLVVTLGAWQAWRGQAPGSPQVVFGLDGMPAWLDGQRVYRAGDAGSWPSGSFLLGGRWSGWMSSGGDVNGARPVSGNSIDGVNVTSSGAGSATDGQVVVGRVHVKPADPARCSQGLRPECDRQVTLESIVWKADPLAAPPTPTIALGPDGIPASIGGEAVLRSPQAAGSGGFLVGGTVHSYAPPCPSGPPLPYPDSELIDACGEGLTFDGAAPPAWVFAPWGSVALRSLHEGDRVVVRAHVSDVLAGLCREADRARCEAAVVLEAIVWTPETRSLRLDADGVPTSLDGERVYRRADIPSLSDTTSFLVGGGAGAGATIGCMNRLERNEAFLRLVGSCPGPSVDGIPVAPMSVRPPDGGVVVARAHTHDPLAGECPAELRARCEAAVVLDGIVWVGPGAAPATPTPAATGVIMGPDGLPLVIEGLVVVRPADLLGWDNSETILIAGVVIDDTPAWRCPVNTGQPEASPTAADALLARAPVCGTLRDVTLALAGAKVLLARTGPVSPLGSKVVLRGHVNDPRAADCSVTRRGECSSALIVEAVVWTAPAATPTPPAPTPTPPEAGVSLGTDGVPTSFDGQPVFRASQIAGIPAGQTSILLTGVAWRDSPTMCPAQTPWPTLPGGALDWNFLPPGWPCDPGSIVRLVDGETRVPLADFGFKMPLGDLVVLRVHTRDPRASTCVDRAACEATFVPDEVVWDGGPGPTPATASPTG